MKYSNEENWKKWVEGNTDNYYGKAIIDYAERWADLMEARMSKGAILSDIAQRAGHDADTEGITGFMYGAAVLVLTSSWIHGDELRRWHNLKTQIGNEGEEANKTGGVLNPAMLSFEEKK